jgi:hypothetical protein
MKFWQFLDTSSVGDREKYSSCYLELFPDVSDDYFFPRRIQVIGSWAIH